MNRRLFLKACALGLVGMTVLGKDNVAFAAKASDATLAALDSAQAEYEAAMAELSSIGSQLEEAQYKLNECQANLDSTNQQISDLETSIQTKQQELSDAQDVLADRVGANYRAGRSDLLDVVLNATSFDDLVSRIYYAGKVSDADAAAIQEVKDLKAELENEESQLQAQKAEQEQLLSDQQAYTDDLASTVSYYESYTASLSSDVTALMAQAQQELIAAQQAEYEAYLAQQQAAQQQAANNGTASTGTAGSGTAGSGDAESGSTDGGSTDGGTTNDYVVPDDSGSTDWGDDTSGGSGDSGGTDGGSDWTPSYSGGNHVPAVADIAWNYIGVPYVWGGTDPSGFDCSGLAQYCYAQAGYSISRTTYSQIAQIEACGQLTYNMSDLQAGDLVFPHSGHVGIYTGGGMMIHAPEPGRYVEYTSVYAFSYGGCPV